MGDKVKRRIVVAAVFAVFLAASGYAQTSDFFDLAKTGTPETIMAAINRGENVKASNALGWTVLMCAAGANQDPGVITTLLKAGADLTARDKEGETSLM
jgi:ankyrin repeat protein